MKHTFFRFLFANLLILGCVTFASAKPDDLPDNYKLRYEQSFKEKSSFKEFMMTDYSAWERTKVQGSQVLSLKGASDYEPPHRSPLNIALIKGKTFGSFVLEVDIQQSGVKGTPIKEYMKEYENADEAPGYAHRDHCFFFGFQDPSHYMYIHIAKHGDNNAHNVFVVNEAPRTPITDFRTLGVDWGVEVWKKIRIVRDIDKGTVALYFDDMLTPIMIADDVPFEEGFIGFGSFDDIGFVDNIKIWAPESKSSKKTFFK
jgi:hypothetical protein